MKKFLSKVVYLVLLPAIAIGATGYSLIKITGTLYTDDTLLVGTGTDLTVKTVPDCTDSTGNHLNYTQSTNAFSCGTTAGAGSAAGSDTQIQFNDGGTAFGGDADHTWAKTTNIETVGSTATPGIIQGGAGSAANGALLTVRGGLAGTTNTGGALTLVGGAGGATSGAGGQVNVNGGLPVDGNGGGVFLTGRNAVGTSRTGGTVSLQAGNSTDAVQGGPLTLVAGTGGATGAGGAATLQAGNGGSTSGDAGQIILTGGTVVSGVASSIQLNNLTSTGAQTATFVAANKPGSATGAPALWLKVTVSGTTYWIPLFAN